MKKLFKLIALSTVFALPFCLSAQSLEESVENTEVVEQAHDCHHSHHAQVSYRTRDLAGNYRISSSSAGGLDATLAAPGSNGFSTTTVGQITFDRDGNGIVNQLSATQFRGFGNSVVTEYTLANNVVATLAFTDQTFGIGTAVITNFPTPGAQVTGTFVAKKKQRAIESVIVNITSISGGNPAAIPTGATLIYLERQ